ncbi:MAG: hypothetical protein IPK70_06065 [Flavobacteriales bacterium]|jgi:hypothetical protein|nr:hypothetical protein [Flavobacteriales bacterium]
MSEKLFKTRRQWQNVRVVAISAPFLLSAVAAIGFTFGHIKLIIGSAGILVVAALLAIVRDRQRPAQYRITDSSLELIRGKEREKLSAGEILDASMMERIACREYVRRKVQKRLKEQGTSPRESMAEFMRFCTIDVGLRSYTFGLGRLFVDRMESSRHDLILLRATNGSEYLLSPDRNQEMIEQLSRLKRRQERAASEQGQL